jgi:hypothetical protein
MPQQTHAAVINRPVIYNMALCQGLAPENSQPA